MVGCMDRLCGIHVVKITTAIVRSFIWPMELFLMMVHTTHTHDTWRRWGISSIAFQNKNYTNFSVSSSLLLSSTSPSFLFCLNKWMRMRITPQNAEDYYAIKQHFCPLIVKSSEKRNERRKVCVLKSPTTKPHSKNLQCSNFVP